VGRPLIESIGLPAGCDVDRNAPRACRRILSCVCVLGAAVKACWRIFSGVSRPSVREILTDEGSPAMRPPTSRAEWGIAVTIARETEDTAWELDRTPRRSLGKI
jgi:hypothetical protein